jgi:ornithine cyclodeaminase
MIVLTDADVGALLTPAMAFDAVAAVMQRVSAGGAQLPLRHVVPVGGPNLMGVMSGALDSPLCYGAKLLSLFPGNPARGLSGHRGAVILFEPETGAPVAMMDAGRLTALRTAAASAVATHALARPDAARLVLIGTGEQAEHHLEAIARIRPIGQVHVVGRRADKAAGFIRHMAPRYPDLDLTCGTDAKQAVRGADIICTVTNSAEPVLLGDWLEPGQHLNIVGASVPSKREVDAGVLHRVALWCDYRPSFLAQAGEAADLKAQGGNPEGCLRGEIGAVLAGTLPGRTSADQITAYRSLGIMAQDLAVGWQVWQAALQAGRGQTADFP